MRNDLWCFTKDSLRKLHGHRKYVILGGAKYVIVGGGLVVPATLCHCMYRTEQNIGEFG